MDFPNNIKPLAEVVKNYFGTFPVECRRLPQAGSDRIYYLLTGENGNSAIATYGPNVIENRTFVNLSKLFVEEGIPVPKIYGADESYHSYLQEDLGDLSLFDIIKAGGLTENLVKKVIDDLVLIQTVEKEKWHKMVFAGDFSIRQVNWDLNYFKYSFLLPSISSYDEEALENDFHSLAESLVNTPASLWGFVYRDFQSRNIMIKDGKPYFIDYQGGRFGPCVYDIVSFLYQAKANFSDEFRRKWTEYYIERFSEAGNSDKDLIRDILPKFILFRNLQVLGAYGFRGLIQNKSHFIESIPSALKNLNSLILKGFLDDYKELKKVCLQLVEMPFTSINSNNDSLTVEIFSFSYKKGYPKDFTGNGGGFMFDCRYMTNPGRYEQYKKLTGRDREVIEFLEERGEVQDFLNNCWKLLEKAVDKYIKRGFTNLQIGFGCTGGQHRSVYCAEKTADFIHKAFPIINIKVIHKEQNITYCK